VHEPRESCLGFSIRTFMHRRRAVRDEREDPRAGPRMRGASSQRRQCFGIRASLSTRQPERARPMR
jgi:hypothetical protein